MDAATRAAEGQEATCEIEWVFWEENSTELTTTVYPGSFYPSWFPRGSTKTTSARQGMQNTPASGTWGWDGRAMTGAEADSHLHHIRGTIITASYEVINSRRHRHSAIAFTCREDTFNTAKRRALQAYRRRTGDSTWNYSKLLDKYTRKYNVRSYGINSDFDDPFPKLKKLAEPGIDEEARSYEVKATWKMRRLLGNGKFGAEIDMKKVFYKGETNDRGKLRFPSYKDSYTPWDFCDDNQKISNLEVSGSITRRVIDLDITERRLRLVGTPYSTGYTGYESYDYKIGTERVVIQEKN